MEIDNKVLERDLSSISFKCSWCEVKNGVKDAFSCVEYANREETTEEDACSTIVPESCVFLSLPDGTEEPLTLDIKADSGLIFKKIHIISEANYIEVYGLFGEYLETVIGELLEDVDGTLAFSCLIEGIKLSQLTLKFVGLKGAKEMWLFGGRIWWERGDSVSLQSGRSLNMDRIDSRLVESNCRLSPSADSLKALVTEYVNRNAGSASHCFEAIASQFAARRDDSRPSTSRNFTFAEPATIPTPPAEFFKTYIDSSLKNMENRVMDNVTEQIRELELRQNKRLDHILKLLENSLPASSNNA